MQKRAGKYGGVLGRRNMNDVKRQRKFEDVGEFDNNAIRHHRGVQCDHRIGRNCGSRQTRLHRPIARFSTSRSETDRRTLLELRDIGQLRRGRPSVAQACARYRRVRFSASPAQLRAALSGGGAGGATRASGRSVYFQSSSRRWGKRYAGTSQVLCRADDRALARQPVAQRQTSCRPPARRWFCHRNVRRLRALSSNCA